MVRARSRNVDPALVVRLAEEHGTPYYLYDAARIRARVDDLAAFDVLRFAQKACSNLNILRLLREAGCVVDSVSQGEIERAVRAGFSGGGEPSGIVFTADVIDEATLDLCVEMNIPVNAGSPDMLEQLGRRSPGHRVWLRVNPGFGHGHSRQTNTGGEWSKHGIWHEYLDEALRLLLAAGATEPSEDASEGLGADPVPGAAKKTARSKCCKVLYLLRRVFNTQ